MYRQDKWVSGGFQTAVWRLCPQKARYGAALFCGISIILPLITNLASMVRYVIGLAPLMMLIAELLSVSKLTYLVTLALFLSACYFMTVAWIGGYLALV
ncbi:hypothetical protein NKJ26_31380 [Mesorhizobium sp. M0152]|uniref:hypothetical protein n=1 Tax=Mesorhizobium sp. M0152 TaxID=2956898 RepID=UPI00333AB083